jgi:hypothetical protein
MKKQRKHYTRRMKQITSGLPTIHDPTKRSQKLCVVPLSNKGGLQFERGKEFSGGINAQPQ